MQLISMPNGQLRLGDILAEALTGNEFDRFCAAIAFARISGVRHLRIPLNTFVRRGGVVQMILGIDHSGTTKEALEQLAAIAVGEESFIKIYHNENHSTFHPKIYLFTNPRKALAFIGSSNLTEGGLYTNYEVGLLIEMDLLKQDDQEYFNEISSLFESYAADTSGLARQVSIELLEQLENDGHLPTELFVARERSRQKIERELTNFGVVQNEPVFPRVKVKKAPRPQEDAATTPQSAVARPIYEGFLMTLMRTDAGRGQTTAGASPRSPEVFVPLAARNANPDFWGWPDLFREDPNRAGKMDRSGVIFRMSGRDIQINMMTWPDKSDFRLRSSALIEEMAIGDILRIEKTDRQPYEYYAEVVPQGTSLYARYLSLCTNAVRNSQKRWGYY